MGPQIGDSHVVVVGTSLDDAAFDVLIKQALFEVWFSRGTGMVLGPRFKLLEDAKRYIAVHRDGASMAIRSPDGRWDVIAPRARQYSSRIVQERHVANSNR